MAGVAIWPQNSSNNGYIASIRDFPMGFSYDCMLLPCGHKTGHDQVHGMISDHTE